jgi:hypothetical protein
MSANPVEKEIEKKVCKYAESKGILQYKFVSPAHRGVPDRVFIMPNGSVFFIEFKRLGEKPTPGQLREHERMRKNDALVWIIDNIEDGKSLIDDLVNAGRKMLEDY